MYTNRCVHLLYKHSNDSRCIFVQYSTIRGTRVLHTTYSTYVRTVHCTYVLYTVQYECSTVHIICGKLPNVFILTKSWQGFRVAMINISVNISRVPVRVSIVFYKFYCDSYIFILLYSPETWLRCSEKIVLHVPSNQIHYSSIISKFITSIHISPSLRVDLSSSATYLCLEFSRLVACLLVTVAWNTSFFCHSVQSSSSGSTCLALSSWKILNLSCTRGVLCSCIVICVTRFTSCCH